MSAALTCKDGPDASGWHVHLLCTCVPEASHDEETGKTSVRAYAHMCAHHFPSIFRDEHDLSTCVRTCVCENPRRTSRHSQGPQYVCAHMCACNSIAHARQRCVRRPDDRAPMVGSVCPSSPVAWLPFGFLSVARNAGVCTPIGGDIVVIVVRHAVFWCFVSGSGGRVPFFRAVRGVPGLFSTRR